MTRHQLTRTQLDWLVMALNHHIAEVKAEMDASPDGSPTQSLGEIFIQGREHVISILADVINDGSKTISIK